MPVRSTAILQSGDGHLADVLNELECRVDERWAVLLLCLSFRLEFILSSQTTPGMKLSVSTIVLFVSSALAAAAVSTKLPTPAQRHIITAAQAQQAIEATIAYSNKIG